VGTGFVVVEFYLTSFNSQPMNTTYNYNAQVAPRYFLYERSDSFFVPNFVVMATGFGRGRICVASFNSLIPKTRCYTQRSRWYLLYKTSYSRFCPKFRCHRKRGHPGV